MSAKLSAIIILMSLSLTGTAWAYCDEDSIETVSPSGDLIVLASGETFDVVAGDEATAAQWQEGDDVLVCGDMIINKDENGERIEVTPH
jgi:hypothetical protein